MNLQSPELLQPLDNLGYISLGPGCGVWPIDKNLRVISIWMVCETRYYIQSQWGNKEPGREEGDGRAKERNLELDGQWNYHNRDSDGICSF